MPRPFTEQEKENINQSLLEHGKQMFSVYGLRKTSVEELARAAGISKAAFYIFYESKEALFMETVERAEREFLAEVLAWVDLPGPSPRARLVAVLRQAFTLWRTIPVLHQFTGSDLDLLARRVGAEKLQQHRQSDLDFGRTLTERCRASGIAVNAPPERITGLLHALFFTVLHQDDLGPGALAGAIDTMVQLVAAYCLGEVQIERRETITTDAGEEQDGPRD